MAYRYALAMQQTNIVSAPLGKWEHQDDALRTMWQSGMEPADIATYLGRTPSAVLTRAVRIGLPRRFVQGRRAASTMEKTPVSLTNKSNRMPKPTVSVPSTNSTSKPSNDNKYVPQGRKCLMCSNQFMSEGTHNRICGKCKESQRYRSNAD